MGKKNDLETIYRNIETILRANLNACITAITAEKADSITLELIDDEAYLFQSMNDSVLNFDPWVFYSEDSTATTGLGPTGADEFSVGVLIIKQYQNSTDEMFKLLRYRRALKECFQAKWDKINPCGKVILSNISPVPFELANSNSPHILIGVELQGSL